MDETKSNIAKRKGGRVSRSCAMNKCKISGTQKDAGSSSNEPVENFSVNEAVPSPSTPNLEKETLSTTAIEDRMALDSYGEDKERLILVNPSPRLDTVAERQSLVISPAEERSIENSIQCTGGEAETETDILAPLDSIESGEMLCFNDIMDSEMLEATSDLTLLGEWGESKVAVNVEERENSTRGNLMMSSPNKKAANNNNEKDSGNVSSNGECGDLNSCSSITSCLLDNCNLDNFDWDWESIVQGNVIWDEKDYMRPWPWEGDHNEGGERHKMGDSDLERQNSMVAWLFS